MSKKILIGLLIVVAVGLLTTVALALFTDQEEVPSTAKSDKVYVATENGGTVDVIDTTLQAFN